MSIKNIRDILQNYITKHCFHNPFVYSLVLFFALLTSTFGCAPKNMTATELTPEEISASLDPSHYQLTTESEIFYYYLLLANAMEENDIEVIIQATQALIRLDPSLIIFQDSVSILMACDRYDEAIKMAEEGWSRFPHDPTLTFLLAEAYEAKGQDDHAITLLKAYHAKNSKDINAAQELARLYLQTDQKEKARQLLLSIPQNKTTPQIELYRARLLLADGKRKEAQKKITALVQKNPTLLSGWLELGLLYESDNNIPLAINAYQRILMFDAGNTQLCLRIITLQLKENQPENALKTLFNARQTPDLLFQASTKFADATFYQIAEKLLEQAKANGAKSGEVLLLQAILQLKNTGDYIKAIQYLDKIAPNDAIYVDAIRQKTQILLNAEKFDQALNTVQEALEYFPKDINFLTLKAFALIKSGEKAQAKSLLIKALKNNPDNEELLLAMAQTQEALEEKDAALKTMERVIEVNPNNALALNYVGYSLAEKNIDLERSLKLITAALQLEPNTAYIVDSLAWVQYRLGWYEQAWDSIKRCLDMNIEEAEMWEHYAEIALALGKYTEAHKGFTKALEKNPKNAKELQHKLDTLTEQIHQQ